MDLQQDNGSDARCDVGSSRHTLGPFVVACTACFVGHHVLRCAGNIVFRAEKKNGFVEFVAVGL